MATFAELVADVKILTNRPDLDADTKLAVKAATLSLHQCDFFYKDLEETGIQFQASDYTQSWQYRDLFPRFRSLKYFRKSDSAGAAGSFLAVLTPAEVLDRYGSAREDICYAAGELIQIKSSTELQYAFVGVYNNPNITEDGWNSWIALDHPYAIVYKAAVTIFKAIGFDEQATVYNKLADEQKQYVVNSNLGVEGF